MKEHQQIEWKTSWRDEYLKWISGFANAEGGTLMIGRNDKGEVVGVPNAAKLLEDIPNKVRDILGMVVAVNLRHEQGKDLLEIVVEPYPSPISYKGEYHVRSGSTKQELKGAALDRFLLQRYGRRWDGVPVPGFGVEDCSPAAFRLFKSKAVKSGRMSEAALMDGADSLLENLQLREGNYLKRAAALLFFDQPEKYSGGAYIKIGFFVTDDDLRYQDEIHGNLFEQVEKTLEILFTKYLKAYIRYEGIQRVEDLIANAFFRAGYIESWGRGIEKINRECRTHDVDPPIYDYGMSGLMLTFHANRQHLKAAQGKAADRGRLGRKVGEGVGELSVKTPVKTPVETPVKTPGKILAFLLEYPNASLAETASAIGKSLRAVERSSSKLVEEGKLRYVGPRKGGHWEVLK